MIDINNKTVAVIGGGASGLICAIELKKQNPNIDIFIFEKLPKLCKKLLATGNGRCNFTNKDLSPAHFYSDYDFLKTIITSQFADTENYFHSAGIFSYCEDGRIYPRSQQATAIRDYLVNTAVKLGINIELDAPVEIIKQKNSSFNIKNKEFDCVLICGGGKASSVHGSDGSCYALAKATGHKITPLYPALCGLVPKEKITALSGVRAECEAALYEGEKLLGKESGEVQFTDKGISGIPVMNLSHLCRDKKKLSLHLNLCEDISNEEILSRFESESFYSDIEEILNGFINSKLSCAIIKKSGIMPHTKLCDVTKNQIESIIGNLKCFEIPIKATRGFDSAQITCGGVDTKDIDSKTMMSKIKNGLFFAGEILDIHGDCGGYNLHLAFTTGRIAANGILQYLK